MNPDELRELQRIRDRVDEAFAVVRSLYTDTAAWGDNHELMADAADELDTALGSLRDAGRLVDAFAEHTGETT
jgi:hypothetical protein